MTTQDVPQKIGRFVVERVLDAGGQGVVYKAFDPSLEEYVAIKEAMTPQFSSEEQLAESKERIRREAIAARKARSENVATLWDYLDFDGRTFLVYEFVGGESLKDLLEDDRRARDANQLGVSLERKIEVMSQIANGLAKAHELGIIHRDIKPDNVRFTKSGIAKILDFGLARVGDSNLTMNRLMGTPAYMSPEQWGRGGAPNHQSDIWACGVILYEMLTYRRPFEGDTSLTGNERMWSIMNQVTTQELVPVDELSPHVPEPLRRIVEKSLEKDTARRYQSVREFRDDLQEAAAFLEGEKERLRTRLEQETDQLQSAIEQKRTVLQSGLAHQLLDMQNAVDKKLWLLLNLGEDSGETVISEGSHRAGSTNSYSGIVFELAQLEAQRKRLDDVAKAAAVVGSYQEDVARLRAEDAQRDDPFDDSRLRQAVTILSSVMRQGKMPDVSALHEDLSHEIERRAIEKAAVDKAKGLYAQGSFEGALKVLDTAPCSGSMLELLRRDIQGQLSERDRLMAELAEAARAEQAGRPEDAWSTARRILESCGNRAGFGGVSTAASGLLNRTHQAAEKARMAAVGAEVQALFREGQAALQAKDYRLAIEKLQAALERDPSFQEAIEAKAQAAAAAAHRQHFDRAAAFEEDGEYREAFSSARKALRDSSGDEDLEKQVSALLARVEQRVKRTERAVNDAVRLRRTGRLENAARKVAEALDTYPKDAKASRLKQEIEEEIEKAQRRDRLHRPFAAIWQRRAALAIALIGVVTISAAAYFDLPSRVRNFLVTPPAPTQVWVEVSPWAEIAWLRNADTDVAIDLASARAPCWLTLPPGEYEIAFRNHLDSGAEFSVRFSVSDGVRTEVREVLPGFDYETMPIDF